MDYYKVFSWSERERGKSIIRFELFYIERVDILSGVADVPRGGFYGNRNTQVRCFFNVWVEWFIVRAPFYSRIRLLPVI